MKYFIFINDVLDDMVETDHILDKDEMDDLVEECEWRYPSAKISIMESEEATMGKGDL